MAIWGLARRWAPAVSFAALGICCGARSELDVPTRASDASEAGSDALPPSLAPCTARDFVPNLGTDVFAVTSQFVYLVIDSAGLYRMAKEGGPPQLVFEFFGSDYIQDFVADESFVWWVDLAGYLTRVPSGGGPKESIGQPGGCCAVASTPGEILVAGEPLYAVPKAGGAPLALSQQSPIHGTALHFAMDDVMALWNTEEHVYGDKLDGSDQTPVAYASWPGGVALHGGFMYWTRKGSGAWRLERRQEGSGELASKLADGISGPIGANDAFAYGGLPNGGGLAKVPVSGGAPSVLVPNVAVRRIVVDGACVYYVEGKSLHRVPG